MHTLAEVVQAFSYINFEGLDNLRPFRLSFLARVRGLTKFVRVDTRVT